MKYLREKAFRQIFFFHNSQFLCKVWSLAETILAALQTATILVAMASEKNISRLKFWRKSPIGDRQIITETYLVELSKVKATMSLIFLILAVSLLDMNA